MNKEELALLSDDTLNSLSDSLNKAVKELREKYGKDRLEHPCYTRLNAFYNMIEAELIRRKRLELQKVKDKSLIERMAIDAPETPEEAD
jgi:hypothetical protein